MSIATEVPETAPSPPATERRAFVRFRCFGPCTVRVIESTGGEFLGMTYNLSRSGIGFALLEQLPIGTRVLVLRVGSEHAGPLYATVVRAAQLANAWFHGCQLGCPLSEEELQQWLR